MSPIRSRASHPRRGSCLFQTLIGLALVGLLLLIVGVVGMATSGAGAAAQGLKAQIDSFREHATVFEAPASIELDLGQGGALVALAPDGMVGEKKLGTPPANFGYLVAVTDADGKSVQVEGPRGNRSPGAPFEVLGTFAVETAGRYTIKVTGTSEDAPNAAIMVAAASAEEIEALTTNAVSLFQFGGSACFSICGLVALLGFGIPALIVRARAKRTPDPVAQL